MSGLVGDCMLVASECTVMGVVVPLTDLVFLYGFQFLLTHWGSFDDPRGFDVGQPRPGLGPTDGPDFVGAVWEKAPHSWIDELLRGRDSGVFDNGIGHVGGSGSDVLTCGGEG